MVFAAAGFVNKKKNSSLNMNYVGMFKTINTYLMV